MIDFTFGCIYDTPKHSLPVARLSIEIPCTFCSFWSLKHIPKFMKLHGLDKHHRRHSHGYDIESSLNNVVRQKTRITWGYGQETLSSLVTWSTQGSVRYGAVNRSRAHFANSISIVWHQRD